MSSPMNIGTLVGYLVLDDQGVEKGIRGANAKIKGFAKTGAQEGGKAGTAIGKAAGDKTVAEYGKAESKMVSKTKEMFGNVGKIALATLGGLSVASVLTKGWDRLTGIENAQAKLRGLGHDGEAVSAIMDNALASVKGTAFGLAEAATAAAGAVAAGIKPGEELESVLKAVANSAAAAGVDMQTMGGIFNKVASLGKAQNDVLQQVADRGLPIYQKLADQLGVTADAVFDMASAGKIGFADFEAAMKSAAGTVADELGQTTTGVLSNLSAAASRLGADLISDLMPAIKGVASGLTGLADAWTALPGPIKNATLALGGFIALSKLGGIAKLSEWLLLTRVRIAELSTVAGPHGLGATLSSLGKSVGTGGLLFAGVAVANKALSDFQAEMHLTDDVIAQHKTAVNSLAGAYRDAGGAVSEAVRNKAWSDIQELFPEVTQWAKDQGIELDKLVDAYLGLSSGSGLRETIRHMQELNDIAGGSKFDRLVIPKAGVLSDKELGDFERYATALGSFLDVADDAAAAERDRAEAVDGSADAARRAYGPTIKEADAAAKAAKAADEAREKYLGSATAVTKLGTEMRAAYSAADTLKSGLSAVIARLDELSGRAVDAEEATRRFNGVLSDAGSALKLAEGDTGKFSTAFTKTMGEIDTSTDAGQKLYDWVTNSAKASRDAALAQAEFAAKTEGVDAAARAGAKAQREQIAAFKDSATEAGLTKDQVDRLIETYFDVPKEIRTTVKGDPDFQAVTDELQRLADRTVWVNIAGRMTQSSIPGQIGGARATGGAITGPGSGTSDSIIARLSNGEHVWTAAEVAKVGGQQAMYNLRRAVMGAPGFASGGSLTPPTAQALSGLPGPQYGPVQSTALAALADYVGLVGATGGAAKDASDKLRDADQSFRDLHRTQIRAEADRERTWKRTKAAEDESVAAARKRLEEVRKDSAANVASAKTADAKAKAQKAATKAIDAAEAALDKARATRTQRLGDLTRSMNRAVKDETKRHDAALKAVRLAAQESAAADQRSAAVATLMKATTALRTEQAGLAAELDTTNEALAGARSALDGLVQASQQMKDSISGRMLGDSSITGFSPGSTIENLIQGMQNRLTTTRGVSSALGNLAGYLDPTILADVAGMGLSGAGLASTLAGASREQINQLNGLQAQLKAAADATGTVVADAIYGNDRRLAEQQVATLTARADQLEASLTGIADRLERVMTTALQGLDMTSGDKALLAGITDVKKAVDTQAKKIGLAVRTR